jgi:hypothetical protein
MSEKAEKDQAPAQAQTPDLAAERRAAYAEALKEERRGYEVRGLTDRVKQVDAQLAQFEGKPKGRTSNKRDTAAED